MSWRWTGTMQTSLLNDRQIRPTEYKKWAHAQRHFERREKDRELVDALKQSIAQNGLHTPIKIGISDRDNTVYVADGHHRAVALMNLGIDQFPFHWYWITSFGVTWEREPFPYNLAAL